MDEAGGPKTIQIDASAIFRTAIRHRKRSSTEKDALEALQVEAGENETGFNIYRWHARFGEDPVVLAAVFAGQEARRRGQITLAKDDGTGDGIGPRLAPTAMHAKE
ncbi:hypothetical protein GGTG_12680 [Gaeumannomyces tritici R3-111a-1]|uniref:Uncharacterized protein n=1 Tax=Gaeumannomyces tritici (strain R3-111a-1) TaxID=644352 RepID=J3PGQ1_GAET3|nr:hypothetical protein GGTG_12680 [Gaeumannomyces tritici R3-111a-1]EJT69797.1 hypothetical protein GGTG_12680 [Gaeumannomyces tritici R3-111a-1]